MSFQFWRQWLIVVTGGVMVYALSLILLPEISQSLLNTLFFSQDVRVAFGENEKTYITFLYGVLGAVIVGWMTTLMFLLIGPFQRPQREIWNTLTASILIWYVVDSGFSVVIDVIPHAIFNTGFLILFAVPLAASYHYVQAERR